MDARTVCFVINLHQKLQNTVNSVKITAKCCSIYCDQTDRTFWCSFAANVTFYSF